ncbi:MAG: hypothetical protein AAF446_00075 [Pseudomonadota bacterium]
MVNVWLWATGHLGEGKSIPDFENTIAKLPRGLMLSFEESTKLANCFDQAMETLIIGCSSSEKILRYDDDQEMFSACDVVIKMDDCARWIIHTHDRKMIEQITSKFENSVITISDVRTYTP